MPTARRFFSREKKKKKYALFARRESAMGFDVTWHPISQEEMFLWYFDRLEEARRGEIGRAHV